MDSVERHVRAYARGESLIGPSPLSAIDGQVIVLQDLPGLRHPWVSFPWPQSGGECQNWCRANLAHPTQHRHSTDAPLRGHSYVSQRPGLGGHF